MRELVKVVEFIHFFTCSRVSDMEAFAAAALIRDIRVVELEAFVQAFARVVEFGSVEVGQRFFVGDDLDPKALEDDIDVAALEPRVTQAREAYLQEAEHISQLRRKAGAQLAVAITAAMQELGMEGGRFEVSFLPAPPSATGTDTIDFLVSGHSGSSPRPIVKVASGGELSRLLLARDGPNTWLRQLARLRRAGLRRLDHRLAPG